VTINQLLPWLLSDCEVQPKVFGLNASRRRWIGVQRLRKRLRLTRFRRMTRRISRQWRLRSRRCV